MATSKKSSHLVHFENGLTLAFGDRIEIIGSRHRGIWMGFVDNAYRVRWDDGNVTVASLDSWAKAIQKASPGLVSV